MWVRPIAVHALPQQKASKTMTDLFYWPPIDGSVLPLPPGWRWDSGYAVFMGLEAKRVIETYSDYSGRYLPYYRLSVPLDCNNGYIPPMPGIVYCLHFSPAFVGEQRAEKAKEKGVVVDRPPKVQVALNYIGVTNDLDRRLAEHLECTPFGSPLVATALEAGCNVTLAGAWLCESYEAALKLELHFKHTHNNMQLCPACVHQPQLSLVPLRAASRARPVAVAAAG